MRWMGWLIWACSHAALALTIAEQEQQYKESLGWAQSAQQGINDRAHGQLAIEDYCADSACVNEVNNPSQSSLNPSQINSDKLSAFYSNETAGAVQSNFNKGRPHPQNDPAYAFALIGQEHTYDLTHGQSNPYLDCDTGQQCVEQPVVSVCHRPTNAIVPCEKVPFMVTDTQDVTLQCKEGWVLENNQCRPKLEHCEADKSCEQWESPSEQCPLGYTRNDNECIRHILHWREGCHLLRQCRALTETCIDGPDTRLLDGVEVTLSCWKFRLDYQCQFENTCDLNPLPPTDEECDTELNNAESSGTETCQTESVICDLQQAGVCIKEEVTRYSTETVCRETNLQCGDDIFCLDGDCYDPLPDTSNDFDQAASNLAALAEAAEGLTNPPLIFRGKGMDCSIDAAGFNNCCKDSGWGQSIGMSCSEEEKALGHAKEAGTTIYLGTFCAEEFLGVCLREKKGYCVFDSKLARIIQEQGSHQQLGLPLGSAEHPKCEAITPEQLQNINFDYIDFSDFYQDMHDSANVPSSQEIQDRLQSAYGGQ
jgi:conjugal transfer mating pair stabilization protein TraN